MTSLGPILLIVLGLGFLVFIHELGHFTVAKWAGVRVETFSIGFGWKLWTFQLGETEYAISALPLGGYVKMAGELPGQEPGSVDQDRLLTEKSGWSRFWIFSAGSLMNLIVAFPIAMLMLWTGVDLPSPRVGAVSGGSPEWKAGVRAEDRVIALQYAMDGEESEEVEWSERQPIHNLQDYKRSLLSLGSGQRVRLWVERPVQEEGETRREERSFTFPRPDFTSNNLIPFQNLIDRVEPGSPADRAGLKEGDRIVQINDYTIRTGQHIRESLEEAVNPRVLYQIERTDGSRDLRSLQFEPGTGYLIEFDDSYAPVTEWEHRTLREALDLSEGDRVRAVNGKQVEHRPSGEGSDENRERLRVLKAGGREIRVHVERGNETHRYNVTPDLQQVNDLDVRLLMPPRVGTVQRGAPADRGGLQEGDRLVSIDGYPVHSWFDMQQIIASRAGREVPVTYRRNESEHSTTVVPEENWKGDGTLGFTFPGGTSNNIEMEPLPPLPSWSALKEAGLREGDLIVDYRREGSRQDMEGFSDLLGHLNRLRGSSAPETLELVVQRESGDGDGERTMEVSVDLSRETGRLGISPGMDMVMERYGLASGFAGGISTGVEWYILTYHSIRQLVQGSDDAAEGVAGPVRIVSIAHRTASRNLGQFLMLLGMISIFLGAVNLLPLPPLDGGHILFLIIETIKGEPVSEHILYLSHLIGFVLMILVFLLITYNDIIQLMG